MGMTSQGWVCRQGQVEMEERKKEIKKMGRMYQFIDISHNLEIEVSCNCIRERVMEDSLIFELL